MGCCFSVVKTKGANLTYSSVYIRPHSLCEEDEYRITAGDEKTRRELIQYLQRTNLFEESLQQIQKVKHEWETLKKAHPSGGHSTSHHSKMSKSKTSLLSENDTQEQDHNSGGLEELPVIYLKLEGMAFLQLGREEESRHLFKQYVSSLLQREVGFFSSLVSYSFPTCPHHYLTQAEGNPLSQAYLHEIASIAMYEENFVLAREYALKAISLNKAHAPSYRVIPNHQF